MTLFKTLPDSLLYENPVSDRHAERTIATWGEDGLLNKRIITALQNKMDRFKAHGYEWQFGREQEFSLIDNHPLAGAELEARRQEIKSRWSQENIGHVSREDMEKQLKDIDRFDARELFMTELHLRLQNVLIYRFGDKFYDAQPGVLEVSTTPTNPIDDVKNFHLMHKEMRKLAQEYGFGIGYRKRDITFTCIDTQTHKCLFDARPDHQDERGLQITDGILRAVYDAGPVFVRMHDMQGKHYYEDGRQYTVGICRDNKLRWRQLDDSGKAALELRDDHNIIAHEHPALENLLLLGGAEFGLHYHRDQYYRENVAGSQFSHKKTFSTDDPKLFFTREILNLSSLGEDGGLIFDNPNRLKYDINKYHKFLIDELALKPNTGVRQIADWFMSMRLEKNADALDIQTLDSTEVSSDPARTAERLAGLTFGQEIYRIRNKLGHTVTLTDGTTNEPNYPGENNKQQYVHFMARSELLKKVLNPGLFKDIIGALSAHVKMAPPVMSGMARAGGSS